MRLFRSRFGSVYLLGMVFLAASLVLRTALFVRYRTMADARPVVVGGMCLIGLRGDVVAFHQGSGYLVEHDLYDAE